MHKINRPSYEIWQLYPSCKTYYPKTSLTIISAPRKAFRATTPFILDDPNFYESVEIGDYVVFFPEGPRVLKSHDFEHLYELRQEDYGCC